MSERVLDRIWARLDNNTWALTEIKSKAGASFPYHSVQYVHADLHEAQQERIQFLEKALGQALMYEEWVYPDERRCPELAEYLKEKEKDG